MINDVICVNFGRKSTYKSPFHRTFCVKNDAEVPFSYPISSILVGITFLLEQEKARCIDDYECGVHAVRRHEHHGPSGRHPLVAAGLGVVDLAIACGERIDVGVDVDMLGLCHDAVDGARDGCVCHLEIACRTGNGAMEEPCIDVSQAFVQLETVVLQRVRKLVDVTPHGHVLEGNMHLFGVVLACRPRRECKERAGCNKYDESFHSNESRSSQFVGKVTKKACKSEAIWED